MLLSHGVGCELFLWFETRRLCRSNKSAVTNARKLMHERIRRVFATVSQIRVQGGSLWSFFVQVPQQGQIELKFPTQTQLGLHTS